jgi:hypothetical protein
MSAINTPTFSFQERRAREQRKIRWNGMIKYGSYEAYDEAIRLRKYQRDQQRAASNRAEDNGEFVPVKSSSVARVTLVKTNPIRSVRGGAFAALFSDDDEGDGAADESDGAADESDDETVQDKVVSNKRTYADAMTTTLSGSGECEAKLTKPTWFEMCDSDDE